MPKISVKTLFCCSTVLLGCLCGCRSALPERAEFERAPNRVAYLSDLSNLKDEIISEIAGDGGTNRTLAMFVLKLNDEVRYSMESNGTTYTYTEMLSNFVDFELKASESDFEGETESAKLKCYIPSIYSRKGEIGHDPTRDYAYILACDRNGTDDPRSWRRYDSRTSSIPTYVVVLVYPAWLRKDADHGWLRESNTELVWSYVKFTADSRSDDMNGRPIWSPCYPVRWFSSTKDIESWGAGGSGNGFLCICPICGNLHEAGNGGSRSDGDERDVCENCLRKRRSER